MPNLGHQEEDSKNMASRSLSRSNDTSLTKLGVDVLDTHPRAESVSETDSPDRPEISNDAKYTPMDAFESRRTTVDRTATKDEPDDVNRYDGSSFVQMPAYADVQTRGDFRPRARISPQINNNYYNVVANSDSRVLIGTFHGAESILQGFDFSLGPHRAGTLQLPAAYTVIKKRSKFASKKRPVLPALLDHQETYKSYTEVTNPVVRQSFVKIARLFTDLDEFFAAMFVHIILASDLSALQEDLEAIRLQISLRQIKESSSQVDDPDPIYLGDLGHHCENLLQHHQQAKLDSSDKGSPPEFTSTQSDEQSWLDYLQDGFEIPYWKMMLDAFSTSRLNKPTLGGKMISRALISMRSDILSLRCSLKETLDAIPEDQHPEGIIFVVDKRINILRGFTDRVVSDRDLSPDNLLTPLLLTAPKATGKPGDPDAIAADQGADQMDQTAQPSKFETPLLVTLVLFTLIAATVPFALGFKTSTETGTVSDADFWLNISSSIFTIMANFVMIIQLTHGSRFSNQYKFVWIWFFIGILCAGVSVAIYPFCNTAWSSLLSFFATIAGFGATLSVTMTVEKPRSANSGAKKKID